MANLGLTSDLPNECEFGTLNFRPSTATEMVSTYLRPTPTQADRGGRGSKNYAARVALARNLNAHHQVALPESESESEDEALHSSAHESLQLVWGSKNGGAQKSRAITEVRKDQNDARKLRNLIFAWNAHALRQKVDGDFGRI